MTMEVSLYEQDGSTWPDVAREYEQLFAPEPPDGREGRE